MPTGWEMFWGVFLQLVLFGLSWHWWDWRVAAAWFVASTWLAHNVRVYSRGRKPSC